MDTSSHALREALKNGLLIADGAAGTYLASLVSRDTQPVELLNLTDPQLVLGMHRQYVQAGAKLLLTNTFGASVAGGSIGKGFAKTASILRAGVELAVRAARGGAFVAGDIGPLPEASVGEDTLRREYCRIADAFLRCGVRNFVFETFPSSRYPLFLARYIRGQRPDAFILISFAVMPDGYSREGMSGHDLMADVVKAGCADAAGFNCCSGPLHLLNFAKTVDYGGLIPSIMPNAGYPQRESTDLPPSEAGVTYSGTPEYFSLRLAPAARNGFRIIGGCCGTTPRHIELLSQRLAGAKAAPAPRGSVEKNASALPARRNGFLSALETGRKMVVVELDPPFDSSLGPVLSAANALRDSGVDAVTVADSPMARPRADSITVAAHLYRECGIEVIPHLCCRDKNLNAIKSSLIAAHMEGLRNLLAVTGDPVPDTDRGSVKSVFNLNSEGLCRFVQTLNRDIFKGDELLCGCAFNPNAANQDVELARLGRKMAAGARFALTQPVFTQAGVRAVAAARTLGVKVFVGVLSPVSYKNAYFLANEMPGFTVPDEYMRRFSPEMTREEGEAAGIALAAEIAQMASAAADGFYLMIPFNRTGVTLRLIGLLKARGIL